MSSEYPRNPDDYTLSRHALNQFNDRKIGSVELRNAIKDGEIDEEFTDRDSRIAYRLKFPGPDLLVIANPDDLVVVSIYYDDEEGAKGGSVGGTRYSIPSKPVSNITPTI